MNAIRYMTYMYSTLYIIIYIYILPGICRLQEYLIGVRPFWDGNRPSQAVSAEYSSIRSLVRSLSRNITVENQESENCIFFDLGCLNQFCAFPPTLPYASKSLPVSWLLKDTAHFGTSTKIILEHQNLVMLEHQKNVFFLKKHQSIKPQNFLRYLLKSV